jgi:hypothetical protein
VTQLPPLNCAGCRTCCLGDTVLLTPQDDPARYKTKRTDRGLALAKGKDGNCVYLGKRGCQIYGRQPAMCRAMDCRAYALRRPDLAVLSGAALATAREGRRRLALLGALVQADTVELP